jgi:DNA repair exonuclease SbcCD nuclease subunit
MTDTHLGLKKGSHFWHDVSIRAFEAVCRHAKENNINRLIHLGDWHDDRKHININTLTISQKIGEMVSEVFDEVIILAGNHDLYYKHNVEPSSLEVLSKFHNIKIIYEPTVINNILFVPWIFDKAILEDPTVPYCIGHFEIGGFIPGMEGTLSLGALSGFKKVLSGHFHTKMESGNVHYLGSPYHMTFSDVGERGFHIFDDENGDLEFSPLIDLPKYITLRHEDTFNKEDITGNIVRIFFTKDLGTIETSKIIENAKQYNPYQLFTKFQIEAGFTNVTVEEKDKEIVFKSNKDLHMEYVGLSEVPENIKHKTVMKMIENLWKEI